MAEHITDSCLLDAYDSTCVFDEWVLEGKFGGLSPSDPITTLNVLMTFHRLFKNSELAIFVWNGVNTGGYTLVFQTVEAKMYVEKHPEVFFTIISL